MDCSLNSSSVKKKQMKSAKEGMRLEKKKKKAFVFHLRQSGK